MANTVMRHLLTIIVLLGINGSAVWAETDGDRAYAEMAAALMAQSYLHPTPISLPATAAAPRHAAAQSAVKRGTGARGASDAAGAAANQASQRAQAQASSQAVAHQAQAAAAAAAGQTPGQAGKRRPCRAQHRLPART